ncbi:SUKH-4 family immunity protein, partial [Streptomyces sp. 900116325]
MVTFAQAQERAEEWVNGEVPAYQHREVRVREFELGFVVWAEDRAEGPVSDGGRQRLVIARDSGEATLWPALPVGEVIRRYEEEYGALDAAPAAPEPPQRIDLNQTSFLLSPPEWLQEAADKLGIPDRRAERSGDARPVSPSAPPSSSSPSSAAPEAAGGPGLPSGGTPWSGAGAQPAYEPTAQDGVPAAAPSVSAGAASWAGTDTNADSDDGAVALPATVFAPPLSGADDDGTPPPAVSAEAPTALMSGGSGLPRTAVAPGPNPQGPGAGPGAPVPGVPGVPGSGDIADAATSKAVMPPRGARGGGSTTPPPPGAPGTPGVRPGAPVPPPSGPGTPGVPAGGYLPTQLVPQAGPPGVPQQPGPPAPPGPPGPAGPTPPPGGGFDHAATMLAEPGGMGGPGAPRPPAPPGVAARP